jgi:hypothetical protein
MKTEIISSDSKFAKKPKPRGFDQLCGDKKLFIVCAQDSYYNMETLRINFNNIGLTDYVHYVGNGQEAIEMCINKVVECADLNQELVTILILDYEVPSKTARQAF